LPEEAEPGQLQLPASVQRTLALTGGDPMCALPLATAKPLLNAGEMSAHQEFHHAG
jgi:arginine N-succinyltransferase